MIASLPSPSSGVLELGPLSLRAYGLCIALGALAAIRFASSRQDRRGGPRGLVESIAWWAVPAGLIGARLYHVATDWNRGDPSYADEPLRVVRIWEGGLGIWGGVALGTAVGCLVAARKGARPLRLMDVAAPAIPIAQAIGRFGNWFNQELFGRPTDLPWGLRIDPENRPSGFEASDTFHPTFLYESLWCLIVVGILLAVERRRRLKPGQLFALYVALYTVGRWVIETLRIDSATQVAGFRVNELVAPAVGTLALIAFLLLGRRQEAALTAPELEADAAAQAERISSDQTPEPAADDDDVLVPIRPTPADEEGPQHSDAPGAVAGDGDGRVQDDGEGR
ncbi:MAG TPA: prolipoprotein diacylglyceryl transferase [Acidimicrobiales bacterium]|nr:prolipoprotein diacylglyceryl transferase [Acidimicrobiales bacterium]